jgi:hypothetical protein
VRSASRHTGSCRSAPETQRPAEAGLAPSRRGDWGDARILATHRTNCEFAVQSDRPSISDFFVLPGSRRAANARAYPIIRESDGQSAQTRMNRAIARQSSPIVVSVEQACHAGGRGFESRRSRKNSCKLAYCVVWRDVRSMPNTHTFLEPTTKRPRMARNAVAGRRFQADSGRPRTGHEGRRATTRNGRRSRTEEPLGAADLVAASHALQFDLRGVDHAG